MTRDEIIRMARESGFAGTASEFYMKAIKRFAALVSAAERDQRAFELAECYRCGWDSGVKAERELCARICDGQTGLGAKHQGDVFASAIRARGEK